MSSANVQELTDETFEREVMQNGTPTLVDFWAAWCAPCRAISPIVEQLSDEYQGKVKFGKMDIDANPRVPMQFEIRSIPTLLMFKDGRVIGQIVGAQAKSRIEDLIKKAL